MYGFTPFLNEMCIFFLEPTVENLPFTSLAVTIVPVRLEASAPSLSYAFVNSTMIEAENIGPEPPDCIVPPMKDPTFA